MKITTVLFDLDGTLLPMDLEVFIQSYFKSIAKSLVKQGYDSEKIVKTILSGTMAMVKNDGKITNEQLFWSIAKQTCGEDFLSAEKHFDAFYEQGFDSLQSTCGFNPKASEIVRLIKQKGLRVAIASNPVFPSIATHKRMAWAGLDTAWFELITTYENSRYCKPNLAYYQDIVNELGVEPSECLMVGNDVREDMIAQSLGMQVFLLTDCLINRDNQDISAYPHGNFDDLKTFINAL